MEEMQLNVNEDQAPSCADQRETNNKRPLLNLVIQRFEGETCQGQPNGEGMACFEGGHVYKGTFSKGLMDGQGVFTWAGGLKYEGSFVSNTIVGQGTYSWPNGSTYQGQVHYGIRHGSGTYSCAKTGAVYSGQWHQGKRQGTGVMYFNQDQSSWYKGDWMENRIEGRGVRQYLSGSVYTGEWTNNLRHGEGTMKWLLQGQQYEGTWHNGLQHGRGTHTWILKREDASRFPRSNQYVGEFVLGQRHGHGAFYFADGAVYSGEWRNNRKHGQGTITFKNGKTFQGEFVEDQIVELRNERPLPPLASSSSSLLAPDMTLDIHDLLDDIPEQRRDSERKEVEFAVWKHSSELRAVYNFYSRLGVAESPDFNYMLSRMQMWRLLKDCKVHHHNITLQQIDLLTGEGAAPAEVHSPFTMMLFRQLLTCLVIVAHHIYHKEMNSERSLLASCFDKLMTNNILPNAKNVKGFLFKQQERAKVALGYCRKSWELYQSASPGGTAMTCRDLLLMFKDLSLFDDQLTVTKFMKVVTKESADPRYTHSSLNLQMTFLEFFETLLGCAEVKHQLDEDYSDQGQEKTEFIPQSLAQSSLTVAASFNIPITSESEVETTTTHTQDTAAFLPEAVDGLHLAEPTEEDSGQREPKQEDAGQREPIKEDGGQRESTEVDGGWREPKEELLEKDLKVWEPMVRQFFEQVFHAFEQHLQKLALKDHTDLSKLQQQPL